VCIPSDTTTLLFCYFYYWLPCGPGSTQLLTEMSTRSISWGEGGRCVRLTTLPPSCVVMKSGNLNFLEPSGPVQASNGTALPALLFAIIFGLSRLSPGQYSKKLKNAGSYSITRLFYGIPFTFIIIINTTGCPLLRLSWLIMNVNGIP